MKIRLFCGILACMLLLTCVPAYIFATETTPGPTNDGIGASETLPESSATVPPEPEGSTTAPSEAPTNPEGSATEPSAPPTEPPTELPTELPTEPEAPPVPPVDSEGYVNGVSKEFMDVLKKLEGFSPKCFWDYKQVSTGYGTVCSQCKSQQTAGTHTITMEEAEAALLRELQKFVDTVYNFSKGYQIKFKQHEFDALVSFSYNVGGNWANDKGNGLHQALKSGVTGSAMVYRFLLYGSAGKEYILLGRRTVEANMFINGVYSEKPYDSSTYPPNYRYVFVDGAGGTVDYRVHGFDANEPQAVMAKIKTYPKDSYGNDYVFDGWYTQREGGTRIEALDSAIEKGIVIYAHWKTADGKPVVIPEKEYFRLEVAVTGNNVNIRSGPQTYYSILGKATVGEKLQVTQIAKGDGMKWGKTERGWIALQYTNYASVMGTMAQPGKVIANGVNVRKGPGTGYESVGKKNTGDEITVSGLEVSEYYEDGSLLTWGKIGENQWICLDYVIYDAVPGDMDDNGVLNDRDVIYLLRHIYMPNKYPVKIEVDFYVDGKINDQDVIYLLRHIYMPTKYPLP